jgi:hypothetical protein
MTGTAVLLAMLLGAPLCAQPIDIDARKPAEAPRNDLTQMGGKAPDGRRLAVNSRYLTLDGVPWLRVMGEMHFSRLDDNFYNGTDWEIGLKRFGDEALSQGLQLKVLPLRKDVPIYIPRGYWPPFPESGETA